MKNLLRLINTKYNHNEYFERYLKIDDIIAETKRVITPEITTNDFDDGVDKELRLQKSELQKQCDVSVVNKEGE
jgi:hypothetical protein